MAPKPPEGDGTVALSGAKILQLIPAAPGWWVRYHDDDPAAEWTAPIVAWALAENKRGWQHIYGVDPSGPEFHIYGDHVNQEVTYFYSPEPPPGAHGVGDPGPKTKQD